MVHRGWQQQFILGALVVTLSGCNGAMTTFLQRFHGPGVADLPPCVDDDCDCGDFLSQALAQAVLDRFIGDPYRLDQDGNGRACEALPLLPPPGDAPVDAVDSPHLVLGNPSNAGGTNLDNYLIARKQYVLSYSRDRNRLNWASWKVDASWLGQVERQDDFRPDGALPSGTYQVTPDDYTGSGYDRGHVVPSADRNRTRDDNSATFLMTNIIPQAPENNRGPWRELENHVRDLVYQYDHSLHLFAGAYGTRGTIGHRPITVPSRIWKVVIVYDRMASGNLGLTGDTQIIAVDMPNRATLSPDWRDYQTSIDRIEIATGYNFLADLPEALQEVLEGRSSTE
jgi:endonuclease G